MGDESIADGVPAAGDAGGGRRRAVWWALAGAAVFLIAAIVVGVLRGAPADEGAAATPSPSVTATATAIPAPTAIPTPTVAGFPQNANPYDVSTLPQVNVFAVIPALPVDDAPFGTTVAERAVPLGAGAPVWADPRGEPVAYLPREYAYDGTTVPIVERQEHWIKVLLTGRQAMPSQGNPAQVAGWMRVSDVEVAPSTETVVVSISARTIDIVRNGVAERIAADFAWGTDATPTPVGRAFIMTTRVVPEYGYTRGHPIVYLSVQSPTLDGFGGADAAVTAFHYHDDRSGPISNGCLRVDPDAITKLSALPLGTPVIVNP